VLGHGDVEPVHPTRQSATAFPRLSEREDRCEPWSTRSKFFLKSDLGEVAKHLSN